MAIRKLTGVTQMPGTNKEAEWRGSPTEVINRDPS